MAPYLFQKMISFHVKSLCSHYDVKYFYTNIYNNKNDIGLFEKLQLLGHKNTKLLFISTRLYISQNHEYSNLAFLARIKASCTSKHHPKASCDN